VSQNNQIRSGARWIEVLPAEISHTHIHVCPWVSFLHMLPTDLIAAKALKQLRAVGMQAPTLLNMTKWRGGSGELLSPESLQQ
jgi:hypothetical protein